MTKNLLTLALAATLPAAAQDLERGRQLFEKCYACHNVQPPSGNDGPALAGVVGRASASLEDFRYSKPMSRANLTWHLAPDALVYYTWSQGFRPGAFNRSFGCRFIIGRKTMRR